MPSLGVETDEVPSAPPPFPRLADIRSAQAADGTAAVVLVTEWEKDKAAFRDREAAKLAQIIKQKDDENFNLRWCLTFLGVVCVGGVYFGVTKVGTFSEVSQITYWLAFLPLSFLSFLFLFALHKRANLKDVASVFSIMLRRAKK